MGQGLTLPGRRAASSSSQELPAISAGWVEGLLQGPLPRETAATCDACSMCDRGSSESQTATLFFDARTKCCTYHPDLANFIVGRILADPSPDMAHGRRAIESKIEAGIGSTPLGIHPPPEYLKVFHDSLDAFGRRFELRCPYYVTESGRCGIWSHRGGVCATWFCKHDRGAVGAKFWAALGDVLSMIERRLALWCAQELGIEGEDRADWGAWSERRIEYYQECARRVAPLGWNDLIEICGTAITRREPALKEAYRRLTSRDLPEALRAGGFEVVSRACDRVRLRGYNPFDPIDVPVWVLEVLDRFDGGATADALVRIARETGVWMPSTLAGVLCDFEILVPPGEDPGNRPARPAGVSSPK